MKRDMVKHSTLEFALRMNIAFKHAPATIGEAFALVKGHMGGDALPDEVARSDALEYVCSEKTIGKHCLLVDAALDLYMQDLIMKVIVSARGGIIAAGCVAT